MARGLLCFSFAFACQQGITAALELKIAQAQIDKFNVKPNNDVMYLFCSYRDEGSAFTPIENETSRKFK